MILDCLYNYGMTDQESRAQKVTPLDSGEERRWAVTVVAGFVMGAVIGWLAGLAGKDSGGLAVTLGAITGAVIGAIMADVSGRGK